MLTLCEVRRTRELVIVPSSDVQIIMGGICKLKANNCVEWQPGTIIQANDSVDILSETRAALIGELGELEALDVSTELAGLSLNNDLTPVVKSIYKNGAGAVDVRALTLPCRTKSKKDFCIFCNILVTRLARHLVRKHREQPQVLEIMTWPNKSIEKSRLIGKIRKEGNFKHNTQIGFNTGTYITCRQKKLTSQNTPTSYIHCSECKGSFSKKSIRKHYPKCNTAHKKNSTTIGIMGRYVEGYAHSKALEELKKFVLPRFNDDEIRSLIVYDELIILMGNRLVQKNAEDWQHDLTKVDLRYLGKLKRELMKSSDIFKELSAIFSPAYYELVKDAVKVCAGFDAQTRVFKRPTVVKKLGTLLKQAASLWRAECALKQRLVEGQAERQLWRNRERDARDFRTGMDDDYSIALNKLANANLNAKKDRSFKILADSDVKKLYEYIKNICGDFYETLKRDFSFDSWRSLAEGTLSYLQVFNRARAGEVQRMTLRSFSGIEAFDANDNPGIYEKLTTEQKLAASTYERVVIRGKWARFISLVINPLLKKYIKTVIEHREAAGVNIDNPYVFGLPGPKDGLPRHLSACKLMVKFSEECGAKDPKKLRGTSLRKHHATLLKARGVSDEGFEVQSKSLGHSRDIHEKHYCLPQGYVDCGVGSDNLLYTLGCADDSGKVDISTAPHVEPSGGEPQASVCGGPASPIAACSDVSDDKSLLSLTSQHAVKRKALPIPSDSDSNDDNESLSATDQLSGGMGRGASTRGSKRRAFSTRRRWTSPERFAVREYFGPLRKKDRLPSLQSCKQLIEKSPCLSGRTPAQIISLLQYQKRQMP